MIIAVLPGLFSHESCHQFPFSVSGAIIIPKRSTFKDVRARHYYHGNNKSIHNPNFEKVVRQNAMLCRSYKPLFYPTENMGNITCLNTQTKKNLFTSVQRPRPETCWN